MVTAGHPINQAAFDLWERTFTDQDDVLMPLIYPSIREDAILFIGLNPSFNEKWFVTIFRGLGLQGVDPLAFYHWRNRADFDWAVALKIERLGRNQYPYFNKFKDIAKHANSEWEHLDLFFYRETSQEQFKQRVYHKKRLSEFGQHQVELAKTLITQSKPKVIVVANAFASSLFQNLFPDVRFDERCGYHHTPIEGRAIPTFFSSMLTGGRAMDVGSYERLRWHVKQAVNSCATG